MKKDYIRGGKQETAIKFYIKELKKKVLKTLINFIMQVIKVYIMEKQQMILLKEKDYVIGKIF